MDEALLSLAAELVGVERVCEVIVNVGRVQRSDKISEGMTIRRFVETTKRRVAVELVSELRSGRLREMFQCLFAG